MGNTPPTTVEQPPRWASNQPDRYSVGERSVVVPPREQAAPENPGLSPAERDLLARIERDREQQRRQQEAALTAERAARQRNSTVPSRPPAAPAPQDNIVVSMGERTRVAENAEPAAPAIGTQPAQAGGPLLTPPRTGVDAWDFTNTSTAQTPPAATADIPQITTAGQNTPMQTPKNEDVAAWLGDQQPADQKQSADNSPQPSSTPVWLLGWTIAVGSVCGNLFQWLNIVDLRNKYRVALRRSSPNFARSMAA